MTYKLSNDNLNDHSPVDEGVAKTVVVENTSKSTLYALIIGINSYPNVAPLRGAVNDAEEIFNFLTSGLKVPSDHIIKLRDESASRANIIKGFRDLRDDPRINKGDPILIYYAGHGGSHQPSRQLKQAFGPSKIQVIFPHDYGVQPPDATEPINCIPDKTISTLLSDIWVAKGDNLTVIFDCCHSASATRNDFPEDGTRQARGAHISMDIPEHIDMDILSSKKTVKAGPIDDRRFELSFCAHQASHIHFAACGDEEKAWEEKDRGAFTVALLKNIRAYGVEKITYHDLMISLPSLPRQSPHCYGVHTSRILFNARVPSRKIVFVPVKFEKDALVLQAGAASGVTYQSVWELHDSPMQDSPPLGRFRAQAPKVTTVDLTPEKGDQTSLQPTTGQMYACQVGHGTGNELKVWFSPEAKLAIFESSDVDSGALEPGSGEYEVGYVAHEDQNTADLTVELSDAGTGNKVVFHLNDPRAEEYGVATLKNHKPAKRGEVEKVLFAAAKWHWHLHRTPEVVKPFVTIELVKLPGTIDDTNDFEVDDNLAPESADSYETIDSSTGVVDMVVQPKVPYGLKVINHLNRPLYASAFYFSPTDFGIHALMGSSSSNARTDPELLARDYSIIGRELGEPIDFTLGSDVKIELGYFKLFWSTDPLDINIEQWPIFEEPEDPSVEPRRELVMAYHRSRKDWGTVLLAVVQRAPQSKESC